MYHYAEDYNGNNIGDLRLLKADMWMPDEDFKLFHAVYMNVVRNFL